MINGCYTKGGEKETVVCTRRPKDKKGLEKTEPLQMILSFAPLLIQKYVTSASIWVNSGGKICLSGYLFAEKGVCGNENGRGGLQKTICGT